VGGSPRAFDYNDSLTKSLEILGKEEVSIQLNVWEYRPSDGKDQNHIDIQPGDGQGIDIIYNLRTNQITGEVSGRGGQEISAEGDEGRTRGKIWFTVDTKPKV
jgi:hypothetical protein